MLSACKGFWAEILGVGDFYYELGVQIIDVCLRTRAQNGGLIEVTELLKRLQKMRPRTAQQISLYVKVVNFLNVSIVTISNKQ